MKKVKDSTTSEISNLFQELIVSKIIDEIELLKKELDNIKESNESCEDKVEKLPKSSSISRIVLLIKLPRIQRVRNIYALLWNI